jgi:hypothetical protein
MKDGSIGTISLSSNSIIENSLFENILGGEDRRCFLVQAGTMKTS